jgi:hypothetical protein
VLNIGTNLLGAEHRYDLLGAEHRYDLLGAEHRYDLLGAEHRYESDGFPSRHIITAFSSGFRTFDTPRRFVKLQTFRMIGVHCLTLNMKAPKAFETSVTVYQSTRRKSGRPEFSTIPLCKHQN